MGQEIGSLIDGVRADRSRIGCENLPQPMFTPHHRVRDVMPPFVQCGIEVPVIGAVRAAIQDRLDPLRPPKLALKRFFAGERRRKGVNRLEVRIAGAIILEGLEKVAHRRIFGAVANQDQCAGAGQVVDIAGRPSRPEIRVAKLRAGQDEIRPLEVQAIVVDSSMEMEHALERSRSLPGHSRAGMARKCRATASGPTSVRKACRNSS